MITNNNKRLLALDILRGLTIIFMIIVNTPGSGVMCMLLYFMLIGTELLQQIIFSLLFYL